ncbi:MAG TPA: PIN domain-containing protein [Solirubrobacteraceae bacterium]
MIAPDSSVLVAALAQWHPVHGASRTAIAGEERVLVGHVAFEATSVLSRMPEPYRMTPAVVIEALERIFTPPWLTLDAAGQRSCLHRAIAEGLSGGALYDALIAATASEHNATLLSADRRARVAYQAMGASVSYVE